MNEKPLIPYLCFTVGFACAIIDIILGCWGWAIYNIFLTFWGLYSIIEED